MELKAVQFGMSVRLPSGAERPYVDITNVEFRGVRLFHLGRVIRLVDTQRKNAIMYIQCENVKACTPLNHDGVGEEIFHTSETYSIDFQEAKPEAKPEPEPSKKKVGRTKQRERKSIQSESRASEGAVG